MYSIWGWLRSCSHAAIPCWMLMLQTVECSLRYFRRKALAVVSVPYRVVPSLSLVLMPSSYQFLPVTTLGLPAAYASRSYFQRYHSAPLG